MADDGLLMNFSIEDGPRGSKAIFRGGRWKARLTAKKSEEFRRKKLHSPDLPHGAYAITRTTHAQDLPPDDETPTNARPSKRQKVANKPNSHSNPPREVVSSLFSSNPVSKPAPKEETPDPTPLAPTNAPLLHSLHTFTSLGLSSQIATHLLAKLSLQSPTAIQKSAISQLLADDSDAFLQAETGSGKTLAYLLPIVQRIMHLSSTSSSESPTGAKDLSSQLPAQAQQHQRKVHRTSGLFAIILAPTRELCKQISTVLESLLRCAHWIVAGTVIGGEKKKSEKARLRRGLNILVATPGRLADHLNHTEVLDVSQVRWLVLDEGDRLMELGFEDEIKGIVKKLEERKNRAAKPPKEGWAPKLPERRTTVMCSATMKMTVQRLGEISLRDAIHIKAEPEAPSVQEPTGQPKDTEFLAPAQLQQSYCIVPAKQRLVTLAAMLKHIFALRRSIMKAIVFLSCADSVDFHFEIFARETTHSSINPPAQPLQDKSHNEAGIPLQATTPPLPSTLPTVSPTSTLTSPKTPHLTIYKLHGSLVQPLRTATLAAFTRSPHPCILLCTDVASRGLDLPNIDLVIEYDPPFSSDDHLHRVGRTARAGREGRAVIFLMPGGEERYIDVLKSGYRDGMGRGLVRNDADETLKKGFGLEFGATSAKTGDDAGGRKWEERATDWQLDIERWVIEDKSAGDMARRAFVSHVRAYATHVAKERDMFDVKGLHLGHLAKAFALRERPGNMGRETPVAVKTLRAGQGRKNRTTDDQNGSRNDLETGLQAAASDPQDASKRMRAKMQEHMALASEFNIG